MEISERSPLQGVIASSFTMDTFDPDELSYNVSDDLEVTLIILNQRFTVHGSRRDALLDMLERLSAEYEQKALALDIQEGNCG